MLYVPAAVVAATVTMPSDPIVIPVTLEAKEKVFAPVPDEALKGRDWIASPRVVTNCVSPPVIEIVSLTRMTSVVSTM